MEIVEHGERISSALLELDADDGTYAASFSRWEDWRPKAGERLGKDVNEKTADAASVSEGPGEKAGKSPDEDIVKAGRRFTQSVEKIECGETHEAFEQWRDSVGYTARAADSSWRHAIRTVEEFVYQHVMTTISPYYFDTDLVQANLTRTSRTPSKQYRFEVNISDDKLRDEIRSRLQGYEETVDRWHVSAPKAVDSAVHTEGYAGISTTEKTGKAPPDRNVGQVD